MHDLTHNLLTVKNELNIINPKINIIAVSKTFDSNKIRPLITSGHIHFGENKVQEAAGKWVSLKEQNKNLKLHMIGKLQTNKVKIAIPLFDYIHSLDNLKLAEKISIEQKKKDKQVKIFIQVNIGNEHQKGGIDVKDVEEFYKTCFHRFNLDIIGLMCIPPNDENVNKYFIQMKNLNVSLRLKELSMGMSSDYLEAAKYGSTYVRIGSKIFGKRS